MGRSTCGLLSSGRVVGQEKNRGPILLAPMHVSASVALGISARTACSTQGAADDTCACTRAYTAADPPETASESERSPSDRPSLNCDRRAHFLAERIEPSSRFSHFLDGEKTN